MDSISNETKNMKLLCVKNLLTFGTFLLGLARCTSFDGTINSIKRHAYHEESLMMALEHPGVWEKHAKDIKDPFFEEWTDYLNSEDDKVTREKAIKDDKPYEFYRLNLSSNYEKTLNDYLVSNHTETDLLNFGAKYPAIITEIEAQFDLKLIILSQILNQLAIIKGMSEETNIIVESHFHEYVQKAMEFDFKRFNFSNLHKAIESIKGVVEVPRKAHHAAEKAVEILSENSAPVTDRKVTKADYKFIIKRESMDKTKAKNEKNLIDEVFKASNRSTSSKDVLFTTLCASFLLALVLLVHNAITSKPADEEENMEEDEECGSH